MKPKFDDLCSKMSFWPQSTQKKRIGFAMYIAFLSFFAVLVLDACSKKNDCCTNIDTAVDVFFKFDDPNAFNPENGRFTAADIHVEYLMGTDWMDAKAKSNQKGFQLFHDETYDAYILRIHPDSQTSTDIRSIRITVGDLKPDVLELQIQKTGNSEVVTQVWVNDSLQWDVSSTNDNEFGARRMVSIIK